MTILFEWLLQPLGLVFCTLIFTLLIWLLVGARPRIAFLSFCSSTLFLYLCSIPSIANVLVAHFERAGQHSDQFQHEFQTPLVVLGGGIDLYVPSDNPYEVLRPDSLMRTLRAIDFADSQTRFYLLGGGNEQRSVADSMKQVLVSHNISSQHIRIETRSRSTHENATELRTILPSDISPKIRLLTSMLHVKRATATFEKNGYDVCPIVGIDSLYSTPKAPVSLLPYPSGLFKTTQVLREWIALSLYRIKGYM